METASKSERLPSRETVVRRAHALSPLNVALAGVLICTLALFGAVNSSRLGIVDPFINDGVAAVIVASHQPYVDFGSTSLVYVPGLGFLVLAISDLSSISPVTLQYVPIAAFFALLATYSLAKRFLPRNYAYAASLIASIVVLRVFSTDLADLWYHTFGFMLFFLFIFVFLDFLDKRTIERFAALWIIFIGIHLYSYTAELWAVSFLLFANVLMLARPKKRRILTFSLFLAFGVTFLGLNSVVFGQYIPKFTVWSGQIATSFGDYLSLLTGAAAPTPWFFVNPHPTPIALILLYAAWYALIFLPLLLVAAYVVYKIFKSKSISVLGAFTSTTAIIVISMLLVWPIDAISYSLIGALAVGVLRYYPLIAPVIIAVPLIYLLRKTRITGMGRRTSGVVGAYFVALLVICACILPLSVSNGNVVTSPDKYTNVDPSAAWFFNSTPAADQILSDLHTQGEYAIVRAQQSSTFYALHFYTPQLYGSLVDPDNLTGNGGSPSLLAHQYIVINLALASGRTTAGQWSDLEALQPHLGSINSNPHLIRIYDDGNVYTLKGS